MMKREQLIWKGDKWHILAAQNPPSAKDVSLVIYFADPDLINNVQLFDGVQKRYCNAHILSCSGAGEILNGDYFEAGAVATAFSFSRTSIRVAAMPCNNESETVSATRSLASSMGEPNLQALMLLADGCKVDGEALVATMKSVLGEKLPIFGGLSSDGFTTGRSPLGADKAPESSQIVCAGFYGDDLLFHYASCDGCSPFGPERRITRARGRVVYDLDGEPALDLFKRYLGEEAHNLPGSALQFPLRIRDTGSSDREYTRTVISVDEGERSLSFAGNIPEGAFAQLMRGSLDRLVEAAEIAALQVQEQSLPHHNYAALLISCAGRKLAYGDRISAEVEAVSDIFGIYTPTIGFYSHGEIAPIQHSGITQLHNHTMTIFLLSER